MSDQENAKSNDVSDPSRYMPLNSPSPLACFSYTSDDEELSVEVIDADRTQVVICDAPGGVAEHTARLTPITKQHELHDWNANTIRSTPPVRLHEEPRKF